MDRWLKTGSVKRKLNDKSDVTVKVHRPDAGDPAPTSGSAAATSDFVCVTESQESGSPSNHHPAESCETRLDRGKSSAKVKRKYHSDYIKFGFFWTGDEEHPNPHCVLCYESLANEAMKPAKLKRHFESKHKDYIGKPLALFERKRDKLKKHMTKAPSHFFATGENAKATEASYRVFLLIAKTGKPHSIGANLVKPAAKVMANVLFGEKASDEINRVPLSNDTVQRRITAMAENVKDQLITRLRQSQFFTLQLDESTDIVNEANLLCFVRYSYDGGVQDEFLFCRSLPTNTTGEAIFDSVNDFILQNNIDWTRCVGICTDGATAINAGVAMVLSGTFPGPNHRPGLIGPWGK
ncbi:zinc finger BED domain-containing protein 5-like [Eleginops maclovinus]|uniref:zinc finger BED domain-containing protein 5-like n=1 Tax=Eleginops maclovinus TaxID=56733 RepID=UPI00307FE1ED